MELVAGNRKRITSNPGYINRDLPCRLNCIGVKEDVRFSSDRSNLFHRLQDSGFVIRHHDRDQLCIRPKSASDIVLIKPAPSIDGEVSYVAAPLLHMPAC